MRLLLCAVLLAGCSQTQTQTPATQGCPARYERQVTNVSATVSSEIVLGTIRFTTLEDPARQTCIVHSSKFIGAAGDKVTLSGAIAVPEHGIWTKPYVMLADEYAALAPEDR